MSLDWLPDTPAYSQLRPPEPKWEKAGIRVEKFFSDNLGVLGETESVQCVNTFPFGRYRFVNHNPPLFIKVLPANSLSLQQQSQKVADWLNVHMLRCQRQIPQYSTIVENKYFISTYEYFHGRFAGFSVDDMAQLGKTVRKLHDFLRECPWVSQVEMKGKHRLQTLKNTLRDSEEGVCDKAVPKYVCELLLKTEKSTLGVLEEGALQVVHGDLNYGNVIFSIQDGTSMLCDFEDTMTAWFAPEVENAFVVERFILAPTDEQSILLAEAYYSEYKQSCESFFKYPAQLEFLLKSLAIRALLILVLKESEYPQSVQESEWWKFVFLYRQAEERSGLLCEISKLH